ncbi:leucine-rich repeat extensin-like protein 3 [Cynara cardunculus var. scolymus]|uniref:leucine-rich repeat extensin-like protein 3 n=1 Tax=Cynara cardunculus var. scolymus TaxID=59895 RepID=UPI000D62BC76|nr:leucine-rich repeat extensin-like protein 3 [Cynara cardunculus var. scolymus]
MDMIFKLSLPKNPLFPVAKSAGKSGAGDCFSDKISGGFSPFPADHGRRKFFALVYPVAPPSVVVAPPPTAVAPPPPNVAPPPPTITPPPPNVAPPPPAIAPPPPNVAPPPPSVGADFVPCPPEIRGGFRPPETTPEIVSFLVVCKHGN